MILDGWDRTRPERPVFTVVLGQATDSRRLLPLAGSPTFSPDERFFVIDRIDSAQVYSIDGSEVGQIRLFAPAVAAPAFAVPGIGAPVRRIGFTPDGAFLHVAELDQSKRPASVVSYPIPWKPEDLIRSACARLSPSDRDLTALESRPFFGERKVDQPCGR